MSDFRSGFVAIAGPTNSGKSTLINALVGEKVSIVSPRPQTTYHGVRGVLTLADSQVVFVDTPGFQNYQASVARLLNRVADRQVSQADVVLWVFDCSEESWQKKLLHLKNRMNYCSIPRILCLNKIDRIAKPSLLPMMEWAIGLGLFQEVIPVSARKRDGLVPLITSVTSRLRPGSRLFPLETKSDRTLQFQLTEWIREQAYRQLRDELPYSLWVELDRWEEDKGIKAYATIHVDSSSRKAIVIGKSGEQLKSIGMAARKSFQKKLGKPFSLFINVDFQKSWQSDRRSVQRYLEL